MFAETFNYQVLIMIDCLLHPIKDQEKKLKVSDAEKTQLYDLADKLNQHLKQIDKIKQIQTKRKFMTSTALRNTIKREEIWSQCKKNINTPQISLTDFQLSRRKREVKQDQKE